MSEREAREILNGQLARHRARSYAELASSVGAEPVVGEVAGASGARYQFEIQMIWDGVRGGDVRVVGAIDDGGWRSYVPWCSDFIRAPDGSFVGE